MKSQEPILRAAARDVEDARCALGSFESFVSFERGSGAVGSDGSAQTLQGLAERLRGRSPWRGSAKKVET